MITSNCILHAKKLKNLFSNSNTNNLEHNRTMTYKTKNQFGAAALLTHRVLVSQVHVKLIIAVTTEFDGLLE